MRSDVYLSWMVVLRGVRALWSGRAPCGREEEGVGLGSCGGFGLVDCDDIFLDTRGKLHSELQSKAFSFTTFRMWSLMLNAGRRCAFVSLVFFFSILLRVSCSMSAISPLFLPGTASYFPFLFSSPFPLCFFLSTSFFFTLRLLQSAFSWRTFGFTP
ncbi:hypothetical protein TRVL_02919 [Trypanosoma vivax]|nr:hypothetical protein TRVL_02919 [Trypanosoma vivax]